MYKFFQALYDVVTVPHWTVSVSIPRAPFLVGTQNQGAAFFVL